VRIPAIEIEIPEINVEVPEFDLYMPGFSFYVSGYDIDYDSYGIHIPAIEIHVPNMEAYLEGWFDDWDDDWDDHWDYQDADIDTTFDVDPNARLELRNHAGEIIVRTWSKSQVRIEASHSSSDKVKVLSSGSAVRVRSESRHGHPEEVDYEVTVPASMSVDLWGFDTDISVDGVQNGVQVETMDGDIEIRNCAGEISATSLEGDVVVQRSSGRMELHNTENDISVLDFEGEMFIESIDGDIRLEGIRAAVVEAKTVDGDVYYEGTIADDGRYRLSTHDGDVVVAIPSNTNATVQVATFDGEFEADFPVQIAPGTQASRKFTFTIGNGSARLELHSFDGDIQLVRR
jgi:DUF4097 and DUF4098 domain-containing protein YvlB